MPDEVNELLEKAGEYLSQALKVLSYSDSLYQRYRPPASCVASSPVSQIDPSDSQSLFAMAQYLQELPHRQDEVEELYLRGTLQFLLWCRCGLIAGQHWKRIRATCSACSSTPSGSPPVRSAALPYA